ncbi:MAG: acyl carrier protein [Actinomycetota bacterium]
MSTARHLNRFIRTDLLGELMEDLASRDDPLAEGLLDSLALEQLITHIEEEFGFQFADEELVVENFESIERLATLVDAKLQEAQAH